MAIKIFESLKRLGFRKKLTQSRIPEQTIKLEELETLKVLPILQQELEKLPSKETSSSSNVNRLTAEIEALIETDKRALELFSKIVDSTFKWDNHDYVDILNQDIESNQIAIEIISSNSSNIMLTRVEDSFLQRKNVMAEYHRRIEERYQMTTVDTNFRYDGTETKNSYWRRQAITLFPDMDLTAFTDLQLKFYVVAMRTMPNDADIVRQALNPARSPEHVRLLFDCVDEKTFAEILMHPEYTCDKIVSMMPSALEIVEESRKSRQ